MRLERALVDAPRAGDVVLLHLQEVRIRQQRRDVPRILAERHLEQLHRLGQVPPPPDVELRRRGVDCGVPRLALHRLVVEVLCPLHVAHRVFLEDRVVVADLGVARGGLDCPAVQLVGALRVVVVLAQEPRQVAEC